MTKAVPAKIKIMKEMLRFIIVCMFGLFPLISEAQSVAVGGPSITDQCQLKYSVDTRTLNGTDVSSELTIAFGDGNSVSNVQPGMQYHVYTASNNYTVTVTVTSGTGVGLVFTSASFFAYGSSGTGSDPVFTVTNNGGVYTFNYQSYDFTTGSPNSGHTLTIDYGDGNSETVSSQTNITSGYPIGTHQYGVPGNYNVTVAHIYNEHPLIDCTWSYSVSIGVSEDPCCSNFAPISGQTYWMSAWVKEDHPTQVKTYTNSRIEFEFLGANPDVVAFFPQGDIIDGWQRIVGEFVVPSQSSDMKVHLVNSNSSMDVYFDDVRVRPFNASMKSYVYDPETLWLTAELDDNNYATFYEYDYEGQLIRIKKETARGIMTIQESRSSNPKKEFE